MWNKEHKKLQKKFTKILKEFNQSLKEDQLWKGRFYIMQKNVNYIDFPDQSGCYMVVHLRMYDHVTGYYKDFILDYANWFSMWKWNLYMKIGNQFIVNDLDAWKECNWNKNKDKIIDCTKIPYIKNDTRKDNWYLCYECWDKWTDK